MVGTYIQLTHTPFGKLNSFALNAVSSRKPAAIIPLAISFVYGGEWLEAGPGAFVYGPRDIAHGFKAIGERPVRMLVMCTPAGFERFVLDQATPIAEPPSPPDMERLMALAERHGIEIHGPLPEAPAEFGR